MSTDQLSPLVADLHLLTVLAATKSFTETARRLGTSKASVSMRISELERTAGVLLVRRTTRSVGLTEAGQQLVADMQPAFERISGSYSAARDLVGKPRGLVRGHATFVLSRIRELRAILYSEIVSSAQLLIRLRVRRPVASGIAKRLCR